MAMIETIREIVEFVEAGKLPSLAARATAIDAQALRVASIKLLGWLKSRARHTGRPLELNSEFAWCANLRLLISASDELGRTFEISDSRLDFAANVMAEDRREIELFVEQTYHPRLMT
jgi:hypothetical protein